MSNNYDIVKIMEVIPQLSLGGAERLVVDLCNELVSQGEVVRLLLFYDPYEVGIGNLASELKKDVEIVAVHKHHGFDSKCLWRVWREISSYNPDVVHTHLDSITYIGLLSFFGFLRRFKILHTVHNEAILESGGRGRRFLRKHLFRRGYVRPVGVSLECSRNIRDIYGVKAPYVVNGRGSLHEELYMEEAMKLRGELLDDKHDKLLLNLATLSPVKNQSALVRGVRIYNSRRNHGRIRLVCVGQIRETIRKDIEDAGEEDVIVVGPVYPPYPYLIAADVLGVSSYKEGLPISMIEAMEIGLPVMSAPFAGVEEIIEDGVDGIIASSFDAPAFARALERCFGENLRELGEHYRKNWKHFNIGECCRSYRKLMCM